MLTPHAMGPGRQGSRNEPATSIVTDFRPTGYTKLARRWSDTDLPPQTANTGFPAKPTAAAACPGTEYWLP